MRTYRYFLCPNGHEGVEKTSENDQPYSAQWERIDIDGMTQEKTSGDTIYHCTKCHDLMTLNLKK